MDLSTAERDEFDRSGFLLLRNALSTAEVERYRAAVDAVYRASPQGGRGEALHALSAFVRCPDLVPLIDHPAAFPKVWSILGWNIHAYHSHIDVHPPTNSDGGRRWRWHQDGGRQNRELEGSPRPRMSVKLAFWLSDVSQPDRGNLMVVPGSHRSDWLQGPPAPDADWPEPEGAQPILANPGDVLLFDRRLWHARSDNHSTVTRAVVFVGYTYRWVAMRDDAPDHAAGWLATCSPVQKQLLGIAGDGTGDHAWGLDPQSTPLYEALRRRGRLDPDAPVLRP